MKIVIDARLIKQSGVGRYLERLVSNLLEIDQENEYLLLVRPEDRSSLKLNAKSLTLVDAPYRWFSVAEQVQLPRLINSLKPDLVHFPNLNVPLAYRKPFVATIHDLTLLRFKNIRGGRLNRLTYEAKLPALKSSLTHAVKGSRHIIVPTEFVARDVVKTYEIPANKIAVTYEAADPLEARAKVNLEKLGIKGPYLLYVGNSYPNKNLERLVEAFAKLRRKYPDLQLVLAGKPDYWQERLRSSLASTRHEARGTSKDTDRSLDKLGMTNGSATQDSRLKTQDSGIIFAGFVEDAQLAGLYQNTEAFVFPSLSEGFGLPPLEAMQAGAAVISSNATCMPEVLGEAAHYFDPTDTDDMAAAIAEVLEDPKLKQALIKRGLEQVKKYSWRRMAKQTLAVYESVIQ